MDVYLCLFYRNSDLREAILEKDGQVVLRFAVANGFRNIQNLVQKLKRGKCPYDFVEIMACPSGKVLFIFFSQVQFLFLDFQFFFSFL